VRRVRIMSHLWSCQLGQQRLGQQGRPYRWRWMEKIINDEERVVVGYRQMRHRTCVQSTHLSIHKITVIFCAAIETGGRSKKWPRRTCVLDKCAFLPSISEMDMDGGYLISLKQFYTEPSRL